MSFYKLFWIGYSNDEWKNIPTIEVMFIKDENKKLETPLCK